MTAFNPDGQGCLARAVQVRAGGGVDAALPWVRAGLALAPQRGDAWHLFGDTLLALGRFDQAFAALGRSLRAAPDSAAPAALLAEAAAHRGRFDLALAAGERWAALTPDDPAPCDWLAGQYWRLGWLDRMLACRRRAALLAPGDAARAAARTQAQALVRRWEEVAVAPRPIPLDDVAFLIPFRLDFPERLRNLRHVLAHLTRHFRTHILISEDAPDGVGHAAAIFAGIDVGDSRVVHNVIAGNRTPYIHRTWQLNRMAEAATAPFIVAYDTDAALAPAQIVLAVEKLRVGDVFVRPFSGLCVDISAPDAMPDSWTFSWRLDAVVHPNALGGAVFFNRNQFLAAGGYNERCLAYGYEDDEIVARMRILGHKMASLAGPVCHLAHPRSSANSAAGPMMAANRAVCAHTQAMSRAEIESLAASDGFHRPFIADIAGLAREALRKLTILAGEGRLAEATVVAKTLLAIYPADSDALHVLGMATGRLQDPDRGLDILAWALRTAPAPAQIVFNAVRLALAAARPFAELARQMWPPRRPAAAAKNAVSHLWLGVKPASHDSAVFAIEPERQWAFGVSTERMTRHKHDSSLAVPPLLALIDAWVLDPAAVRNIDVGVSLLCAEDGGVLDCAQAEAGLLSRAVLGARFASDVQPCVDALMAQPEAARIAGLLETRLGRQFLARAHDTARCSMIAHISMILKDFFPNAEIRVRHFDHEYCHALSAWASFPEPSGLSITMDGVGDDKAFSRVYRITPAGIEELAASAVPSWNVALDDGEGRKRLLLCSPGGVYTWFTEFLGFAPNADEGKVEALAAFGEPIPDLLAGMTAAVRHDHARHVLDIDETALARLLTPADMRARVERHGAAAMAATVQRFLEETILNYVRELTAAFDDRPLFLSGGVFANVILNLRLFEEVCPDIRIAPAMADDGSAQGAAVLALLESGRAPNDLGWLKARRMPYFGSAHGREAVVAALIRRADAVTWADMGGLWPEAAAERLAQGQIGAVFHGRMEWGPRALGNRSILADPRPADIRERLNRDIKRRPPFQPFCPSILLEERERLFENAQANPHMTCAFRMRPEHHAALPGAVHIDGTARVQFVEEDDNPAYWRLLRRMKALTGYGVVLNTSFNKHGRTIVESPDDALTDFLDANLDFLCIEGFLVVRAPA